MKKRDKYLIISILAVIAGFTANIWLATDDHQIPDVCNAGWFAFWGTEIWHLARIKINEKKGESYGE
jgi:hypothetical protein